jgi:hypothetical protein
MAFTSPLLKLRARDPRNFSAEPVETYAFAQHLVEKAVLEQVADAQRRFGFGRHRSGGESSIELRPMLPRAREGCASQKAGPSVAMLPRDANPRRIRD